MAEQFIRSRNQERCPNIPSSRTGDPRSVLCNTIDEFAADIVFTRVVAEPPFFNNVTFLTQTIIDPVVVESSKFSFSMWFKITGNTLDQMDIIRGAEALDSFGGFPKFVISRLNNAAGNLIRVEGYNNQDNKVLDIDSKLAYTDVVNPGWHNLLISMDLSLPKATMYIDDVNALGCINTLVSTSNNQAHIAFDPDKGIASNTSMTWEIGGGLGVIGEQFEGCLTEIWIAPDVFFDFDNFIHRRKFISNGGLPINLSTRGGKPLRDIAGVQYPFIFLNNLWSSFVEDEGTRSAQLPGLPNFDVIGLLQPCADSPG